MNPYASKKDQNQNEIAAFFVGAGCIVFDASWQRRGWPDIWVICRGVWHPIEIKQEKEKMTPAEIKWAQKAQGNVDVVRTVEQAHKLWESWARITPAAPTP